MENTHRKINTLRRSGRLAWWGFLSIALFGICGCETLRPDYAQKLKEETADLERRWNALNSKTDDNHAEALRLYAYQCGYVAGLEDAANE